MVIYYKDILHIKQKKANSLYTFINNTELRLLKKQLKKLMEWEETENKRKYE
jgi:hypothetical protein